MQSWRDIFVIALILLGALSVAGRIVFLATVEQEFLKNEGDKRAVRQESVLAARGRILDRNGIVLAENQSAYSIAVRPSRSVPDDAQLRSIASILKRDPDELINRVRRASGRDFLYVARFVSPAQVAKVRLLEIDSLLFEGTPTRDYPLEKKAAHVVGLTNVDNRGIEGAELAFETNLSGSPGKRYTLRDRLGRVIEEVEQGVSATDGGTLTLSIDSRLQILAYRSLRSVAGFSGSSSASLLALDPETGGILALVNLPTYDPYDRTGMSPQDMRNRSITDVRELGRVIVPFVILSALESGEFQLNSVVDTAPGLLRVSEQTTLSDPRDFGRLELSALLREQSSVGLAKVALNLPNNALFDTLQKAGFLEPTGVELPGETSGRIANLNLNSPAPIESAVSLAALANGYGISATLLQLTSAYSILANSGVRVKPSVLKSAPVDSENVYDASNVNSVTDLLEISSKNAKWRDAHVPGLEVYGYGGFAEATTAGGGYREDSGSAFFVGFTTRSNGQIVVGIVLNGALSAELVNGPAKVFSRFVSTAVSDSLDQTQ